MKTLSLPFHVYDPIPEAEKLLGEFTPIQVVCSLLNQLNASRNTVLAERAWEELALQDNVKLEEELEVLRGLLAQQEQRLPEQELDKTLGLHPYTTEPDQQSPLPDQSE